MKPYFSVNIKLKEKTASPKSPISLISIPPGENPSTSHKYRKSLQNMRFKSKPSIKNPSFLHFQGILNQGGLDSSSSSPVVRSLTPDQLKEANLIFFKRVQMRNSNKSTNFPSSKSKKIDPDLPQINSGCFVSHFNKKTLKHSWALDMSSENYRKHVRKLKDLFNLR
jgi:hypothetical protein